ncbi:MAG: hypothetical protein DMF61_02745 [Blastocatellia bacterium AA13]|nr:MAG: hypothetical protein DMF61_02745 [Blastocatellia bacterium AA13]
MIKNRERIEKAPEPKGSKKVGILLPSEVYVQYEQIAKSEYITVAQVIARVAIQFLEIETTANRSRRKTLDSFKEALQEKYRPVRRKVVGND